MPYADTEAMQEFLDRFSDTIADDEHVAMFADRAGWHIAGDLRVPDNITLIQLPAYSPELNPVERVWLYLKERFLSHRLHADYDAIAEAACNAWNRLLAEAGRITSLCSYPDTEGRRRLGRRQGGDCARCRARAQGLARCGGLAARGFRFCT